MKKTMRAGLMAGALVLACLTPGVAQAKKKHHGHRSQPIVIGHRGAPAYRPEHTLGSYRLAIELGADYIEPDLVSTRDHQLVARHEPNITDTTDVAQHPEFAGRRTTKTIDGVTQTGWFTDDFTLAELKTLRATERLPAVRPRNTAFDGRYEIPTFQEVIDLAKKEHVGIYPETKHPTYFDSKGLSLEEPLVATLRRNGLDKRNSPVFIQSFEVSNLQELNHRIAVPLVQLTGATGQPYDFTAGGDPRTYADLTTADSLTRFVSAYADGIGPDKAQILPGDTGGGHVGAPTSLIRDAHRAGLVVHPYTFRPENVFLAADFQDGDPASPYFPIARGDEPAELALFYRLGVDGLFADNADTAVAVRHKVFSR
jgi:glycerophosphoryl diester phosphodiesterase